MRGKKEDWSQLWSITVPKEEREGEGKGSSQESKIGWRRKTETIGKNFRPIRIFGPGGRLERKKRKIISFSERHKRGEKKRWNDKKGNQGRRPTHSRDQNPPISGIRVETEEGARKWGERQLFFRKFPFQDDQRAKEERKTHRFR